MKTYHQQALVLGSSVFLALFSLAMQGCNGRNTVILPQGEQQVTGEIKRASLSITRRGTHVLLQDGRETAYLESATVDLGDYEDREVRLSGAYELNTDPRDLPVIVVRSVEGGLSLGRSWNIPALGISLDTPKEWRWTLEGTDVLFTVSGNPRPVLSMFAEEAEDLLSPEDATDDVSVRTVTLRGKRTVRSLNKRTRVERIQILRQAGESLDMPGTGSASVLTLLFTPLGDAQGLRLLGEALDEEAEWEALKDDILASLVFTGESSSALSSPRTATGSLPPLTGSGAGSACGGEAGILCPNGMYCEITDAASNVGRCKEF